MEQPEASAQPADDAHGRFRTFLNGLPHPVRWALVTSTGTILILAGIAMLVLPGPGIASILAGIAVLAAEFPWAERLLRRIRLKAKVLWAQVRRERTTADSAR